MDIRDEATAPANSSPVKEGMRGKPLDVARREVLGRGVAASGALCMDEEGGGMRYAELPNTPEYGVSIMCRDCGAGPWSASRGDYFMRSDDETVLCECGSDMMLVRHVEHYEPYYA